MVAMGRDWVVDVTTWVEDEDENEAEMVRRRDAETQRCRDAGGKEEKVGAVGAKLEKRWLAGWLEEELRRFISGGSGGVFSSLFSSGWLPHF